MVNYLRSIEQFTTPPSQAMSLQRNASGLSIVSVGLAGINLRGEFIHADKLVTLATYGKGYWKTNSLRSAASRA